ncbi:MAG: DUF6508 domain-containing protein [Syntrophorhabdaceae bacterium]
MHSRDTIEKIDSLLSFLPGFEIPNRKFTNPNPAKRIKQSDGTEVIEWTGPDYHKDVQEFINRLEKDYHFWNDYGIFSEREIVEMMYDEKLVRNAGLEQIKAMIAGHIKSERLGDGHWREMLQTGRITALLKRLQTIRERIAEHEKDMRWTISRLRRSMVECALTWQAKCGVAPSITSVISESDAAKLIGCDAMEYSVQMVHRTAVSKHYDFMYKNGRYQVKANRPSGKPGSKVTWVPKPNNYEWDYLIWILYDTKYNIEEAWIWGVDEYKANFDEKKRLSPADMRKGQKLYPTLR